MTIRFFLSHYDKYARIKITRFFPYIVRRKLSEWKTPENAFQTVYGGIQITARQSISHRKRYCECSCRKTRVCRTKSFSKRTRHIFIKGRRLSNPGRFPTPDTRRRGADPAGTCISMSVSITVGPDDPRLLLPKWCNGPLSCPIKRRLRSRRDVRGQFNHRRRRRTRNRFHSLFLYLFYARRQSSVQRIQLHSQFKTVI